MGAPEDPAFPSLSHKQVPLALFMKVCFFVAALSEIVLGAITVLNMDLIFATGIAMTSVLFALGDICVAAYFRGNIIKLVTVQTYIMMIAVFFIDKKYSGLTWSITFVIPILFLLLMAVTLIIGKCEGLLLGDYVIYIILDVIMSMQQMIPVVRGINKFPYIAVSSASILLAMAAFVIIFRFNDLKNASVKYLNM